MSAKIGDTVGTWTILTRERRPGHGTRFTATCRVCGVLHAFWHSALNKPPTCVACRRRDLPPARVPAPHGGARFTGRSARADLDRAFRNALRGVLGLAPLDGDQGFLSTTERFARTYPERVEDGWNRSLGPSL